MLKDVNIGRSKITIVIIRLSHLLKVVYSLKCVPQKQHNLLLHVAHSHFSKVFHIFYAGKHGEDNTTGILGKHLFYCGKTN